MLLELIMVIVVVGLVMWVINSYIPMPRGIKSILNLLVLILVLIYILQFFGLINPIIPFPKLLN